MSLAQTRYLFIALALFYLIFPFDLDQVGILGRIDDLLVIVFLAWRYRILAQRARDRFEEELASDAGGQFQESTQRELTPSEVLGVSPDASAEEIEKRYKDLLRKYHPDKVHHLGEEFQALAHEKTVAIQNAYEQLRR